jgi:hypothetical protein
MADVDPFVKFGLKSEEDPFAKFGLKSKEAALAPETAAPEAESPPESTLSKVGDWLKRKGYAGTEGAVAAIPFGTHAVAGLRSLKGPESFSQELALAREEQAAARKAEPAAFETGRFGMTVASLPIAAGKGLSLAQQALRFGALGGAQAASEEGADVGSVLKGAATSAAVPVGFGLAGKAAEAIAPAASTPALKAGLLRAGQAAIRTAPPAALAAAPVSTLISPEADTADKYEALANLGLLGSMPALNAYRGLVRTGAQRAGSISEQALAESRRVIGEQEAARGETAITSQAQREAEQAIVQRREANKRAQREVGFEQSVDVAADKLKGGAQRALSTIQGELATQQQLIQALENATDPSLLGWRAKQFQDMANRLNSYEASWNREYPGQPLPDAFNAVRSKLDQSLMRNTQLMGSNATENFLADPDAKFAEYQARKVAEGKAKEADMLQRLNGALAFANKDFSAEARAQVAAKKPQIDDARRAAIYAKHGLVDPGPQTPFASPVLAETRTDVSRGIVGAPVKKGELAALYREQGLPSGATEADILRTANVTPTEAARLLQEQRTAARNKVEFGTPRPTESTQRQMDLQSKARALYETTVPPSLRGGILLRGLGGRLSGSDVASRSLPEYSQWTSPTMSTEARMKTPFEALEIADSFARLLRSDAAVDSGFRKFVEQNPQGTWLAYLRSNPVVAAKVEAERQKATEEQAVP